VFKSGGKTLNTMFLLNPDALARSGDGGRPAIHRWAQAQ